jgi:hypothetical protein
MLQRRFRVQSPKYPLEIDIHEFYQYLTEHLGDVCSVHITPLASSGNYDRQILLQFRPNQQVVI